MPYILTNANSTKFLTPYGWSANKDTAYQFRTKDDAIEHARTSGQTGALAMMLTAKLPPGVQAGGAKTVFGYDDRG